MNNIDNSSTKSSAMTKVMMTCFALLIMMPVLTSSLIAISSDSLAQGKIEQLTKEKADKTALSKVMCNVFSIVTGAAGKTFAAFAIVSVGIGFFTGKVSWGLMVGVAAGIAAIFGAPTIVQAISGGTAVNCATDVFGAA